MANAVTMNDEVLGLMTWHDEQAVWTFEAGPVAGHSVRGAIFPEERRNPLAGVRLDQVRTCIQWIRENELAVREHLVAEGFDCWRDNCGDKEDASISTSEEFRDRLSLAYICFFYDGGKAKTVYEVGEQTIWVTLGPNGACEPGVSLADRAFWGSLAKLIIGDREPEQLAAEIETQQNALERKPWWAFWR